MSEFTPTPDHILRARTLSDAELVNNGAEYINGVLNVTAEQRESFRQEYLSSVGRTTLEAAGLVLNIDKHDDGFGLETEASIENLVRLESRVKSITEPYEHMLTPYFPDKVGFMKKEATATYHSSRIEDDREVKSELSFRSAKYDNGQDTRVIPTNLQVSIDQFGATAWSTREYVGWKSYERDSASFGLNKYGEIKKLVISTVLEPGDCLGQVKPGPYDKGVALDLIGIIDKDAVPTSRYSEIDGSVNGQYRVGVTLHEGDYRLTLKRWSYNKDDTLKKGDTLYPPVWSSEAVTYKFIPEKNKFIKLESTDAWDVGPEEVDVDTFTSIVESAMSNIPANIV